MHPVGQGRTEQMLARHCSKTDKFFDSVELLNGAVTPDKAIEALFYLYGSFYFTLVIVVNKKL